MSKDERQIKDSGDDVAVLVRLAGQRPPIAEERIERTRTAARETWLRETRRRSRSRIIYGAVTLAAAASLVLLATIFRPSDDGVKLAGVGGAVPIRLLVGEASIHEAADGRIASARALAARERVSMDSLLSTSDTQRASVLLPSGHSLRLDHSTRIRVAGPASFVLDRGAIYITSGQV